MKNLFLLIGFSLMHVIDISAQIKVADDAYKESLSASKYVTEPISIENCFNAYDGSILDLFYKKNLVGDTIYTNGAKVNCLVVDHVAKSIVKRPHNECPIPKGYYRITGIFLSNDVGSKEMAEEIYLLVDSGYSITGNGNNLQSRESLEDYLKRVNSSGKTLSEINTMVQEYKLRGELPCDLNMRVFHRLESLDSSMVYYTSIDVYSKNYYLPVKFYNLLERELKGNDVYMTYKREGGGYVWPSSRKLEDALTGTTIFQKDSLFRCIDIVVNDKLQPCCVLEGANTGKFAIMINKLVETNKREDCVSYYSTPTDKMTIWQPNPYESSKGKLIRDRHFSASRYKNTEEWQIIKVNDLNKIYTETKRYLALTAAQQKQEADKYMAEMKAKEAKRKHELCNKYGNEYGTLIASKKVALGMTSEMCKQAWGTPTMISNMIDATGKYTIWKYNLRTIIFFRNGLVVRIQN